MEKLFCQGFEIKIQFNSSQNFPSLFFSPFSLVRSPRHSPLASEIIFYFFYAKNINKMIFHRIISIIIIFKLIYCNCKLIDVIIKHDYPLFMTYTTGHNERIEMTQNLLKSLELNSPKLRLNVVISCLDELACKWCDSVKNELKVGCYCINNDNNNNINKSLSSDKKNNNDGYRSDAWSNAVLKKIIVAKEIADNKIKAFLSDHDIVIRSNFDNYFDRGSIDFFGKTWAAGHNNQLIDGPSPSILTMCDFSKTYKPLYRRPNTGFMIFHGNDEVIKIINLWIARIENIKKENNTIVKDDQPPFQDIIIGNKNLLYSHRCIDEDQGMAMWFHRKTKLTGSKRTKSFYMNEQKSILVFHANDMKSSDDKIELMKKLRFWYLKEPVDYKIISTLPLNVNNNSNIPRIDQAKSVNNHIIKFNNKDITTTTTSSSSSSSSSKDDELINRISKNGKFYIYDWPINITDLHPASGVRGMRRRNSGAGPIIDPLSGQFNTYMHNLFPLVYSRLLRHPMRTLNPQEANAYFIPYDISADAYNLAHTEIEENISTPTTTKTKSGNTEKIVAQNNKHRITKRRKDLKVWDAMHLLHLSIWYQKYSHLHFFIDSSEPFWYEKRIVTEAFYPFCKNCMKLTPSSIVAPYQNKWAKNINIDNTFYHIPYTSTWHYYEREVSTMSGGSELKLSKWAWNFDINNNRKYLVSFVGIIKKMNKTATNIRRALVNECKIINTIHDDLKIKDKNKQQQESNNNIINNNDNSYYLSSKSTASPCAINILNKDSWKDFGNEAKLYRDSIFCFLPPGDIVSRKAIFDMLLAGCIPVIFDNRQIDIYKWHINPIIAKDIVVRVDINTINSNNRKQNSLSMSGIINYLSQIPRTSIIYTRKLIKLISWNMQYSIVPIGRVYDIKNNKLSYWSPPQPDAVDVIIHNVLLNAFKQK